MIIAVKLIASLNVSDFPIYIVKVTEENMTDAGGVSVACMTTESLTSVSV